MTESYVSGKFGCVPGRPLLKTSAAAAYLGITRRHLQGLMKRAEITFHKIGGLNMFDPDDLDAYKASTRIESQP